MSAGAAAVIELLDSSASADFGAATSEELDKGEASLDKTISPDVGEELALTSVETLLELLSTQAARKNRDEKI